jgi:hypothetical protein
MHAETMQKEFNRWPVRKHRKHRKVVLPRGLETASASPLPLHRSCVQDSNPSALFPFFDIPSMDYGLWDVGGEDFLAFSARRRREDMVHLSNREIQSRRYRMISELLVSFRCFVPTVLCNLATILTRIANKVG